MHAVAFGFGETLLAVAVAAFSGIIALLAHAVRENKKWKSAAQTSQKVIEKVETKAVEENAQEKKLHGTLLVERKAEMAKTGVSDKFIDDLERDLKKVKDE